jgi:Carboxypeptidase regulatory-like domain
MRWLSVFALSAAFSVSVVATAAFAQTTGAITGTVTGLGGDAVANAPIRATELATKKLYTTASSEKGSYTIAQLPAGAYDLSVDVPGFNSYSQKNLAVAAGQALRFDIHLIEYQLDTLGDGREFRISLLTPHATPSGPTPRAPDGKPDLSGVWYAQRTVDPGKPEPLPWADTLQRERAANNSKDAPGAHCLPRGLTNAGALFPFKLVQTPALLIMLFEDDTPSHRQVFLDGRGHPKDPNPNWMGHSIGHWEGETLVVDTVGFNDQSWLDSIGHPHTEMLHITERLHRVDLGHLEIEFTIDDPATYSKPWIIKRVADLDTKDEIGEYVCIDRDASHLVGK